MVTPADSSVLAMRDEIRSYVGISSNQILTDSAIDQEINYFYTANIPESIKMDQLRDVYVTYTLPYVDRYPVDTNKYQSFRAPVYVDGRPVSYFKDRGNFYATYPNVRTDQTIGTGDGTTTEFNATLSPVPIVPTTFMISSMDETDTPLICADDGGEQTGTGTILRVVRDDYGNITPPFPPTSPLTAPTTTYSVGSIVYETGTVALDFPDSAIPQSGTAIKCRFTAPVSGIPTGVLFFNNELMVRPIPRESHKIEIETYKTPVEFISTADVPFLLNFKKYICLGVAMTILTRWGDTGRKSELQPDFIEAEGRVLERQANAEIGQANNNIFQSNQSFNSYPYGGYWY